MESFKAKISIDGFKVENLDISDIENIEGQLPRSGVFDLNIAERGLVLTLEGQNLCQDKIIRLDRYLGHLEMMKNRSWSEAALVKAKDKGYKTAKDKEWFAQADSQYIAISNDITLTKATKKWLENKSGYFSGWHYAFKTFLRRDYSIENSTTINYGAYNKVAWREEPSEDNASGAENMCNDGIDWDE